MGIWNEVTSLAAQSDLNERRTRLQGLLADRAAGKFVSENDLRAANQALSTAEARVRDHERRREEERESERERERTWNDERARQRQENDRILADYAYEQGLEQARRREHIATVEAEAADTRRRMARSLRRMLDGVSTDNELHAANDFLFSLSLLAQEEADLFGPDFAAAYAWVTQGVDKTGALTDQELLSGVDPDAFEDEMDYRATVGAQWAIPLLHAALQPWGDAERAQLALSYPMPPQNLPAGGGAPLRLGKRQAFAVWDSQARRLDFLLADRSTWLAKPWFSMSLPDVERYRSNADYEERGNDRFCFSQDGQFLYLQQTLYRIIDQATPVKLADFGIADLGLQDGQPLAPVQARYHAHSPVQLLALDDGSVLMLWHVRAAAGKPSPFEGIIAVDPVTRTERWRLHVSTEPGADTCSGIPSAVDSWLFNTARNSVVHLTWRPRAILQAPAYPFQKKASLFSAFGAKTAQTAPGPVQREILSLHIDERDVATGALLRSVDLYGAVPGCLHNPKADLHLFEQDGLATLADYRESKERPLYGVLDLDDFVFDATRAQFLDARRGGRGGLGENRVETLLQMVRHFGEGHVAADRTRSSVTKLLGTGKEAVLARLRPIAQKPHLVRPHTWNENGLGVCFGPINQALGVRPVSRFELQPLGAFKEAHRQVSGTFVSLPGMPHDAPKIKFALFADPRAWNTLEEFEQQVTDDIVKVTPGVATSPSCPIDLYGARALQRTIGSYVITVFIAKWKAHLFVMGVTPAEFERARPHMEGVLQHLGGIFPLLQVQPAAPG